MNMKKQINRNNKRFSISRIIIKYWANKRMRLIIIMQVRFFNNLSCIWETIKNDGSENRTRRINKSGWIKNKWAWGFSNNFELKYFHSWWLKE